MRLTYAPDLCAELPNRPLVSIKRRRCAAPGPASAPGSARKARPPHAGPHPHSTQGDLAHPPRRSDQCVAASPPIVQLAASTHPDLGAYEEGRRDLKSSPGDRGGSDAVTRGWRSLLEDQLKIPSLASTAQRHHAIMQTTDLVIEGLLKEIYTRWYWR
jgi:hypothetical protein